MASLIEARAVARGPRLAARSLASAHGRRLALYGLVGLSGLLVNSSVLFLLVSGGHVNHLIAAGMGSEVSIVTNFALNDRLTFRGTHARGNWFQRLLGYNAVALGGMLISLAVLAALTVGFGMYYMVANLIAIGFATVSNYVLNSRLIWLAPRREAVPVTVPVEL